MINSSQKTKTTLIKAELEAISTGTPFGWGRLSRLLDLIDNNEYWRDETDSFTEWIKRNAKKLGTTPASLWRYLSAGRFYRKIQTGYPFLIDKPLEELAEDMSPENLELLAKISRVAPADIFKPLESRVVSGEVKRSELRSTWAAFRPVLEGKTTRGRGVTSPTIATILPSENEKMLAAVIKNQISSSDASWTLLKRIHTCEVFTDIKLQDPYSFDVVVVTRGKSSALMMHGIKICYQDSYDRPRYIHDVKNLATKCDILWLALPSSPKETMLQKLPLHIGVLKVDTKGIKTIRAPKPISHVRDTEALSRLLLEMALKR